MGGRNSPISVLEFSSTAPEITRQRINHDKRGLGSCRGDCASTSVDHLSGTLAVIEARRMLRALVIEIQSGEFHPVMACSQAVKRRARPP